VKAVYSRNHGVGPDDFKNMQEFVILHLRFGCILRRKIRQHLAGLVIFWKIAKFLFERFDRRR
jgi:hypothetical protein